MMMFVAVVHILVAIILITLVLIQDSKGGGALGIGGGGSNSLLGATGAQTLAAKLTRWAAVVFAVTCISLTIMTAKSSKSVLDQMAPVTGATTTPAATDSSQPAAPAAAPVETQATPPAESAPAKQ